MGAGGFRAPPSAEQGSEARTARGKLNKLPNFRFVSYQAIMHQDACSDDSAKDQRYSYERPSSGLDEIRQRLTIEATLQIGEAVEACKYLLPHL